MLARFRAIDREIKVLYAAMLLLGIAYGATTSVLSIHLEARKVSTEAIGGLATFFAAGIAGLSLPAGRLVRWLGARTVLRVALATYIVGVIAFPHMDSFGTIAGTRLFDGASSVCVWVACETILLARSSTANKAFATSLYAMSLAVGYVLGPILSKVIVLVTESTTLPFRAAAVLAVASFLVLSKLSPRSDVRGESAHGGSEPETSGASATAILWRMKTSAFATFGYGYFQASVVLFLPIYLMASKNVSKSNTVLITAFFAAGMLLFTVPFGRMGDRFGHLIVMRVLAIVGTSTIVSFVFLDRFWVMAIAVFINGATIASISPLSLALQGHVIDRRDFARANGMYNAFYAGGMLVGPLTTALIFARWGGPAFIYHLAALWAAFIVFTVVFAADDPRVARLRRSAGGLGAEEGG